MKNKNVEILSNRQVSKNTFEMVLSHDGTELIPGQFINIRIEGFFLRRPVSICDWDDKTITIIYKLAGGGTAKMSQYVPGRKLDILIPLGNGYDLRDERIGDGPIVIGGGAGVPPMFGLCRKLVAEGLRPAAVLGFRSSDEMFYIEKFNELGVQVAVATEDGSYGAEGFVTDLLSDLECTSFFACGPEAMLRAVDRSIDKKVNGWFSFEERMGCGFGACMGCSCKTRYGSKRICKDGPVLEREEIIW